MVGSKGVETDEHPEVHFESAIQRSLGRGKKVVKFIGVIYYWAETYAEPVSRITL